MKRKEITLALQGGGSHGAFTWGVLEQLFEKDLFDITGICGTSAGAMNAGIAVYGYHLNGNQGAIDLLNAFWKNLSNAFRFSPIQQSPLDKIVSAGNMEFSPGYNMFSLISNYLSPYQWNPLDLNPLKDILEELIDFRELRKSKMKLFTCATNVKTGQAKVFDTQHISLDALLASACLPLLYKAVKVDSEYYWDGGYMGNPPLYPLIKGTNTNDIVLVQINPCRIKTIPTKADEILHRINEVSFNSSLIAELRLIEFKNKILANGYNMNGKLRKVCYHMISADNILERFDVSSKSNSSWEFINLLKKEGKKYAARWIEMNYARINNETSADFSVELANEFMS